MAKYLQLCMVLLCTDLMAQDIINPYKDYYQLPKPDYRNISNTWLYDTEKPNYNPYWGEYQVFVTDLLNWKSLAPGYVTSVTLETVSFPMTNDCWDEFDGCTYLNTGINAQPDFRHLHISHDPLMNDKWSYLYREHSSMSDFYALMSQKYASDGPFIPGRRVFPHTVIKHTFNLHCGPNMSYDVIASLSWTYDHSRGRMRFYPFNCSQSQPLNFDADQSTYDLIFMPEILYNYNIDYDYSQSHNKLWIDDGMLNNFHFSEILPIPCNPSLVPTANSIYYDLFNGLDNYPAPPPFSILGNTAVRSDRGKMIAGYNIDGNVLNPNASAGSSIDFGIKHKYTIDYNFLLDQINPAQRVIYNFSEVDITAPNLYFPSGYTFKTIRGVYPTLSEVALSMGVAGNYHDLRDVPVITDLVGEDQSDVSYLQPVRSSKYYIKSGGKLTIEPCVTIYDATFLKEANSTLVFQDRASTYGRFQVFEESTTSLYTHTFTNQQGIPLNYNLVDSEGQVTKPVSLVPQGFTFLYESNNLIESGIQQIPANLNIPDEISPATHVVFVAENEVKLTEGFNASAYGTNNNDQSVFHAMIWPSVCSNIVNRQSASVSNNQVNYQPQSQLYPTSPVLTPNPTAYGSVLHYSVLEPKLVSVMLYNATGQLVSVPQHESLKEKGNHSVAIHTEGMPPGIYMCTLLTTAAGNSKPMQVSKKLVVK